MNISKMFLNLNTVIKPNSILNSFKADLRKKNFKLLFRSIDMRWKYYGHLPYVPTGFNPFESTIFIPNISTLNNVLQKGVTALKSKYQAETISFEIAFLLHDYMHVWTYAYASHYLKEMKHKISSLDKNREDMVFIHLLSESVATVGVDYWFFCQKKNADVFKHENHFEALTVPYRKKDDATYKKFYDGKFKVTSKTFFKEITEFYANGVFQGFSKRDLMRNKLLRTWVGKELTYGELQRKYIRQWLCSLTGTKEPNSKKLGQPIILKLWMNELIEKIGKDLFEMVIEGKTKPMPARHKFDSLYSKNIKKYDSRFYTLKTALELKKTWALEKSKNWKSLMAQTVSRLDFEKVSDEDREKIKKIFTSRKGYLDALKMFQNKKYKLPEKDEPKNLFQLP